MLFSSLGSWLLNVVKTFVSLKGQETFQALFSYFISSRLYFESLTQVYCSILATT